MTEQELITASGGEICGGAVIAVIGGKNTVLGKRGPGGVFNLTLDGVKFVEDYTPTEAPKETKAPKKAKAEEAKSHDLSLDELVETADKLG